MEVFVNREHELQLIDESFDALPDRKRLLCTPIIEFQGVGGIGSTYRVGGTRPYLRRTRSYPLAMNVITKAVNRG